MWLLTLALLRGWFAVFYGAAPIALGFRADPLALGHVAGGGGDEGAKPFINAKIAAFL